MKDKKTKLGLGVQLGFGIGTAADSIPYTIIITYEIFFLTDVAGVSAAAAGVISSVSVLCTGIASPIVGYLSDNSKNPKGRRLPFMIKFLIAETLAMMLFFAPVTLDAGKNVFYMVAAILLCITYTGYTCPYQALGAEITDDYNGRNNLVFWKGLMSYPLCVIAESGTVMIVGICTAWGDRMAWFIAVGAVMACCIVCEIFTFVLCKGHERTPQNEASCEEKDKNTSDKGDGFLKECIRLIRVKACRKCFLYCMIFSAGYTIMSSICVYNLTYNAGLGEAAQASFWIANTVLCVISLPLVTLMANRVSKKFSVMFFLIGSCIWSVAFYFIDIDTYAKVLAFSAATAFLASAYYGIYHSILYDTVEVAELKYGKRQEGGVTAISVFFQTIGAAVGSLLIGVMLTVIGYDGEAAVQSASTIHGLLLCVTLVPAFIILVGIGLVSTLNLGSKRFEHLKETLEKKRRGEYVDMEEFKDLL